MNVFLPTIDRMAFLFSFIIIGYLLVRLRILDVSAAGVLSKLENKVFLPAMVMGTFLTSFTPERLGSSWWYFLAGFGFFVVAMPVGIFFAHRCVKEAYLRRIYTYGLVFSNFSFMGNAVVSAVFPELFAEYLIFTLPLWIMIQLWAVPALLIGSDGEKPGIKQSLKSLANPMLIGMVIGMVLGLTGLPLPTFVKSIVTDAGACMSPVAMLLTGITVAGIDISEMLKIRSIWEATLIRLVLFPLVGLGLLFLLPFPEALEICIMCALAMPLGLNTVVIPAAYGRDTSQAAGMALVSHMLSCFTIPFVFLLLQFVI